MADLTPWWTAKPPAVIEKKTKTQAPSHTKEPAPMPDDVDVQSGFLCLFFGVRD